MIVVADTNTIVSGLLWHGAPRQILELARQEGLQLATCSELLDELHDVLQRPKFIHRLNQANVKVDDLVLGYTDLARVVTITPILPHIIEDPDDDIVLACALAVHADMIISGDQHLLKLQKYQTILIVSANDFLEQFSLES
ncbi:MAG: putative toxin-antitoxin system toxin component, PIN family [Herpetosiphon sp.]|nr:putative toxin-antitoxin system toxin component, PIN family [Herpetosiphon sp.]